MSMSQPKEVKDNSISFNDYCKQIGRTMNQNENGLSMKDVFNRHFSMTMFFTGYVFKCDLFQDSVRWNQFLKLEDVVLDDDIDFCLDPELVKEFEQGILKVRDLTVQNFVQRNLHFENEVSNGFVVIADKPFSVNPPDVIGALPEDSMQSPLSALVGNVHCLSRWGTRSIKGFRMYWILGICESEKTKNK